MQINKKHWDGGDSKKINKDRQKILTSESERGPRQILLSSQTVQARLSYTSLDWFRTYIKINTKIEQVTKPWWRKKMKKKSVLNVKHTEKISAKHDRIVKKNQKGRLKKMFHHVTDLGKLRIIDKCSTSLRRRFIPTIITSISPNFVCQTLISQIVGEVERGLINKARRDGYIYITLYSGSHTASFFLFPLHPYILFSFI